MSKRLTICNKNGKRSGRMNRTLDSDTKVVVTADNMQPVTTEHVVMPKHGEHDIIDYRSTVPLGREYSF